MADSKSLPGARPVAMISASCPPVRQLSLEMTRIPACSSRMGSARAPGTDTDGPIARTMTLLGCVPVTMNPPIKALSPVSTFRRVEMFPKIVGGVTPGVAVGDGDAVGVGDGGGVGVGVGETTGPVRRARQLRAVPLYRLKIPPTRSFPSDCRPRVEIFTVKPW